MKTTLPEATEEAAVMRTTRMLVKKVSPSLSVLNGPFKGLRYPSGEITEFTLLPKLSGGYEKQLFPLIETIVENNYNHIIDVGCAEGYYAIGFAKRSPGSTIHCYDINERDLELCREMAELNSATNLTYNTSCSEDTLKNFHYGDRSLIFCDCEGYEIELFTEHSIPSLGKVDILVELHDNVNPSISRTLIDRFAATHDVELINNWNIRYDDLDGLGHLSPAEKAFALTEHRGGMHKNIFMEWAFFTPKRLSDQRHRLPSQSS